MSRKPVGPVAGFTTAPMLGRASRSSAKAAKPVAKPVDERWPPRGEGGREEADLQRPAGLPRRRLTLAELLSDPEESERLTREVSWMQEIPAVGHEIG